MSTRLFPQSLQYLPFVLALGGDRFEQLGPAIGQTRVLFCRPEGAVIPRRTTPDRRRGQLDARMETLP